MATRSGSIDPGALLYLLLRESELDAESLDYALNFESGLTGLAGSGDMSEIDERAEGGDDDALLALDVFTYRVAAAIAAMAVATDGLDALVFTAGIGEGSAPTRARVCKRLGFLGVEVDSDTNRAAQPDTEISTPDSVVRVWVIRAREDVVAARAARDVLVGL